MRRAGDEPGMKSPQRVIFAYPAFLRTSPLVLEERPRQKTSRVAGSRHKRAEQFFLAAFQTGWRGLFSRHRKCRLFICPSGLRGAVAAGIGQRYDITCGIVKVSVNLLRASPGFYKLVDSLLNLSS